jgi:hypothetical protein
MRSWITGGHKVNNKGVGGANTSYISKVISRKSRSFVAARSFPLMSSIGGKILISAFEWFNILRDIKLSYQPICRDSVSF